MVKGVTMTMFDGEPTLVFWHVMDIDKGMAASRDMGLPVTSPREVSEEITRRIWQSLLDDPEPEEGE